MPLAGHAAFDLSSPDAAAAAGSRLLSPHALRLAEPDGPAFHAVANAVRFRQVMLACFTYGAELDVFSSPLERIYAVNMPLTGSAHIRHRGEHVESGPATAAVFSPVGESTMRWSPDFAVLCLAIDRGSLDRHLSRLLEQEVSHPITFTPGMPLARRGACLQNIAQLLIDIADRMPTGSRPAPVTDELESALMTALLLVQPHNHSEALLSVGRSVSGRTVRKAIDFMRAHHEPGLTVGMVAEQVGVSERSLQLAFKRQLGTSPVAYLRDIRLDHARRTLLSTSSEEMSISRTAADAGFVHLSRFAQLYQSKFGEKPSQTLRSLPFG
jgi:AraC-like DNA-binding protein